MRRLAVAPEAADLLRDVRRSLLAGEPAAETETQVDEEVESALRNIRESSTIAETRRRNDRFIDGGRCGGGQPGRRS